MNKHSQNNHVAYVILRNKRPSKHPLMSFHVLKDPKTEKNLYIEATNFFAVHGRLVSIPYYYFTRKCAREFYSIMDKSVFSLWQAIYSPDICRITTLLKKNP